MSVAEKSQGVLIPSNNGEAERWYEDGPVVPGVASRKVQGASESQGEERAVGAYEMDPRTRPAQPQRQPWPCQGSFPASDESSSSSIENDPWRLFPLARPQLTLAAESRQVSDHEHDAVS